MEAEVRSAWDVCEAFFDDAEVDGGPGRDRHEYPPGGPALSAVDA